MKEKILYYINSFLIYSIIGFLLETTLKTFFIKGMNNGILYGPWIPVYGIGGILIEKIFGKVFWDYSDMKFSMGHYISLEMALVWGVMSLVVTYVIKPFIDKIIKKIPSIITYLVFITFIMDVVFTFLLK